MQLTKQELNLIYHCLTDCANSDDWQHLDHEIWGTAAKVRQMVDAKNFTLPSFNKPEIN